MYVTENWIICYFAWPDARHVWQIYMLHSWLISFIEGRGTEWTISNSVILTDCRIVETTAQRVFFHRGVLFIRFSSLALSDKARGSEH